LKSLWVSWIGCLFLFFKAILGHVRLRNPRLFRNRAAYIDFSLKTHRIDDWAKRISHFVRVGRIISSRLLPWKRLPPPSLLHRSQLRSSDVRSVDRMFQIDTFKWRNFQSSEGQFCFFFFPEFPRCPPGWWFQSSFRLRLEQIDVVPFQTDTTNE